jgi:uncharacterized protein involved in exopolysaccharide biosynthesis
MITRIALLVVGLGLLLTGLYHTLAQPKYVATIRLRIDDGSQANLNPGLLTRQIALIQSDAVLSKVTAQLNLAERWPRKSTPLFIGPPPDLLVSPMRAPYLIQIRAAAAEAEKAATLANTVADVYRQVIAAQPAGGPKIIVLDAAVPPRLPKFPNRYLGGFSALLGAVLTILGYLLIRREPFGNPVRDVEESRNV